MDNLKILLAGNNNNVRTTAKYMLQEMGITHIAEAENGQIAKDYFDANSTDINFIISDWNMPHKTGLELLKEIRRTHPDIPFVMSSVHTDKSSIMSAKLSNVTDYLCKPYSFKDLQESITKILKNTPSIR